ncbi:acyltransferase [Marinobacter daqiaonensis]|uniref:acyltransferase n=1 Tax=Marinobacter daqiaonensis TaxID=650891 RepID=UPI000B89FC38|nr:acyltransferase [Marinobacter daqiaonensis]
MLHALRAAAVCLLILLITLIGIGPMMIMGLIKALIPFRPLQRVCSVGVMWIAETWAEGLKTIFRLMTPTVWDVRCDVPLGRDQPYLVISNHQSWVDIPALVEAFNRRTPFFKFFLKKELIWVPLIGLAFWALDYPFMKRYSREHLEKHPEDRGKDLEITQRACEKFHDLPVTVVNFLEGTRYTTGKHRQQDSPYHHLLRPKSGGVAFVMAALGEQMRYLLDVTIVYPEGRVPGFWHLLSGQVSRVIVDIRGRTVPPELFLGDYANDPEFRKTFQAWVSELWRDKDARIEELRASVSRRSG